MNETEQYTHVVLWKKGEDGSIEVLAQASIPRLDDPYWPNPLFLFAPDEAGALDDPEVYAKEVAESMGDSGDWEDRIKIRVAAGTLLNKGLWTEACQEVGLNEWIINEGQMDRDEEVTLTQRQAKKIGLL